MRSDFMLAINQLCAERKLSREVVLEAVEASLVSAYKRNFGATTNIEVQIEPNTGDVRVFAAKEVVDSPSDRKMQITLDEARQVNPEVQLGETVLIESTPRDFGRIAAQTAKQVILQRIREAERDALFSSFADSAGEIAHGTIQSVDYHSNDVVVSIDGAEAILPVREQVPTERYRRGGRLRAYVLDVRRGSRGPQITLSRRSPALLRRLLELEVPEIFNGSVEIKAIAREAGSRSKVAVHATQEGVDPVGSCVGVRGGRIQNVVNELGGEKIDVVQWSADMASFIANALSPAKVMNVLLDDHPDSGRTATVIVPDRQLSLAIGKDGQNARLAAKLTGWRIDIKSATEATEETFGRLDEHRLAPKEMDLLTLAEVILQKADGYSQEEMALIEADLNTENEEDVAWSSAETVAKTAAEAKVASGQRELTEQAILATSEEVEEGPIPVAQAESASQEIMEESTERAQRVVDEVEPTFEGEPVEESTGWVQPEPSFDYTPAWPQEEQVDNLEPEWLRFDTEEEEEEEEFKKDKKKKKKGRKRPAEFEENLGTDDWRWRRTGHPREW
jgi:N utilization substance protein A